LEIKPFCKKKKKSSKTENEGKQEEDLDIKDTLHGEGMHQFQKDLDIVDDTDPALLLIAWKLRCEIVWEISLEEFYNGFTIFGCSSMDHIKKKIKQWKSELHDPQSFRNFYNFVFDYLKEDKKNFVNRRSNYCLEYCF